MATPQPNDDIRVVNAPISAWGDLYHQLLRLPWWTTLLAIAALFIGVNVLFACAYLAVGGVVNLPKGSFTDAFFFSVQTLGTIGYGTMYPATRAANLLMTLESLSALLVTALSTGLVFSKFSMPTARIIFSQKAVIFDMDGERTLAIRLANQRGNYVVEAQLRVTLVRLEKTREGQALYRMHELTLVRDRSPALGRSWTVLHRIAPGSPLHGATPATLREQEAEILATVVGIDGTSAQTIHARHVYDGERDAAFGHRYADMLTPTPDGKLQLDFARFHDVVPAPMA